MKKLLLLLLIVPDIGNSQVKSFDDLKQINSVQQFKRVAIENSYEKGKTISDSKIQYLKDLTENKGRFKTRAYEDEIYWKFSGFYFYNDFERPYVSCCKSQKDEWEFSFIGLEYGRNPVFVNICYYDKIVDEIKKQCVFYKVIEEYGNDIILYSCPDSSYKGKIGFYEKRGEGFIKHLIGR